MNNLYNFSVILSLYCQPGSWRSIYVQVFAASLRQILSLWYVVFKISHLFNTAEQSCGVMTTSNSCMLGAASECLKTCKFKHLVTITLHVWMIRLLLVIVAAWCWLLLMCLCNCINESLQLVVCLSRKTSDFDVFSCQDI